MLCPGLSRPCNEPTVSTVHTKFYCASGPTDSRLLSSRRFSLPRCLLCLSLSLELYCFFHLVHSILLVIRAFFYYLATIDRSRSVCPHLHETVLQDLTLEDRDSVEVSHEFRNRLLTELHRRFEQVSWKNKIDIVSVSVIGSSQISVVDRYTCHCESGFGNSIVSNR